MNESSGIHVLALRFANSFSSSHIFGLIFLSSLFFSRHKQLKDPDHMWADDMSERGAEMWASPYERTQLSESEHDVGCEAR